MAQYNAVAMRRADSFGNYRIARVVNASLANTGNAVATLPLLGGGMGGASPTGSFIIRRITIQNPINTAGGVVPNMSTANVTILTSNDGNTSNAVTTAAGQTIGNVTAGFTWQDLTLASGANTTAYQANALFLLVGTAVANSAVTISVYGDMVEF